MDLFRGDGRAVAGCVVATQILTAGLSVETLDNGLPDAFDAFDGVLHLAGLYALAVDLDHPVLTVHVDHIAVGQLTHDVVGV